MNKPPQPPESNVGPGFRVHLEGATLDGMLIILQHDDQPEQRWRGIISWQMLQTQSAMTIAGKVAQAWYVAWPALEAKEEPFGMALTMTIALVLTPEGKEFVFDSNSVLPADFVPPTSEAA